MASIKVKFRPSTVADHEGRNFTFIEAIILVSLFDNQNDYQDF